MLVAEGLTAGYGKVPVIEGISLHANSGAVVSIIGANGSGKSTLLKAMFGQLRLDAGRVQVDGVVLSGQPAYVAARNGLGYVPQVANVFPNLTVRENLEMGAYIRQSTVQERIDEVLLTFPDLKSAVRKRAGALSGGQRNLLAIARAMMLDPKVLLMDEPTSGLSPLYTDVVWAQVKRLAEARVAVVVVEQNVDLAIQNSDWIYVLVGGRNHLDGTPEQMLSHDMGAIFLGDINVQTPDNAISSRQQVVK